MAVTLVDMAMLEKNPLRKGIINAMIEEPFVIDRIPWENTNALNCTVTYISGVPVVSFRNINEAPANVEASVSQFQETLKVMEVNIDVDWVLTKPGNLVQNPRTVQTEAVSKGLAYTINDLFINGDPTANPKNPTGLKYRLVNDARYLQGDTTGDSRGQIVDTNTCNLANTANYNTTGLAFLDKFDEAIYKIDGHRPSMALMNRQTLLRVRSLLRGARLLDQTKDQFDRKIDTYSDIPLLDIGVKAEGALLGQAANQILGNNNETSQIVATANTSSIYLVRTGASYTQGLQMGGLETIDLGQLKDSPHLVRTNLRWILGFYVGQPRAIARLCGFIA